MPFVLTLWIGLVWLAFLKYFGRLQVSLVVVLALLYLSGFGWTIQTASSSPTADGLWLAVATLVLFFFQKRSKPSPLYLGARLALGRLLPWLRGALLLGLAVPGMVRLYPVGLESLTGMVCLAILSTEGARRAWRGLGLLAVPGAAWCWLLGSLSWWAWRGDPLGALLLLLLLRERGEVNVRGELSPAQATVMLKMPVVAINALIELVPASSLKQWFRPDPFRLHLREPLLETQNAPAYFAAFAEHLNRVYGECIQTELQLADFCVGYPESAARAVLTLGAPEPVKPGPEFQVSDLGALRKPGKLVQLAHLVKLRKIR
ncbi:hypothetical protein JST97_34245 [bacterium]|nr:hypothetical protein [bacterium]